MYTKVEEALLFMIQANKGKRIKIKNVDVSFHPICVGMMIRDITDSEDVICAAILHDMLTKTDCGYEEIEEKFGVLVADMVFELSEDLSITKWFDRKREFLKKLKKNNDINIINIVIADYLNSLLMLEDSFRKYGDKIWKNTLGTKDENSYVYRESYNLARKKGANPELLNRYKKIIKLFFGDVEDEDN